MEDRAVDRHFTVKNGQVFVVCEAPGGVYNSDQLRKICEVAEEHSAFLKVTEDQRLGFLVDPDSLPEAADALKSAGIPVKPYRQAGSPTTKACLGELCPRAQQDALSDSIELATRLAEEFPQPRQWASLGVNGCEEGCANSALDDLHILGESTGYKISIGGRAREIPQIGAFLTENVAREQLPEVIARVLRVFFTHQEDSERLSDVVERLGIGVFLQALDDVPTVPSGIDVDANLDIAPGLGVEDNKPHLPVGGTPPAAVSVEPEPELGDALVIQPDDGLQDGFDDSLDQDFGLEKSDELVEDGLAVEAGLGKDEGILLDAVDEDLDLETFDDGELAVDTQALDSPAAEEESLDLADAPLSDSLDELEEIKEDVGLTVDLEEETDISLPASPKVISTAVPVKAAAPAGLDMETLGDDVELEEATLEDLERVTQSLRSEVGPGLGGGEGPSLLEPSEPIATMDEIPQISEDLDPIRELDAQRTARMSQRVAEPKPVEAVKPMAAPAESVKPVEVPKAVEPAKPSQPGSPGGRFRIKMGVDNLDLVLPGDIEFSLPFDAIPSEGALEVELEGQTLCVERAGPTLILRYGGLSMTIPYLVRKQHAAA